LVKRFISRLYNYTLETPPFIFETDETVIENKEVRSLKVKKIQKKNKYGACKCCKSCN
jgi:hypothetical protein